MASDSTYEIYMTPEANQDLRDILFSIAKTKEDAVYAKRLICAINDRIFSLSTFPRAGTPFPGNRNLFMVHVKHYKIAYGIHEPSKRVVIIRVGRSSRDFSKLV